MEDFIYILLLIAWIAFAFYRRSRQKQAARQPRPEPKPEPSSSQPSWEEILFGKENEEPEMEHTEEIPEMATEPAASKVNHPDSQEGVSLEKMFGSMESIPSKTMKGEKEKPQRTEPEKVQVAKSIKSKLQSGDFDYFDLRQAVIYSEILNRPYD